MPVTTNLGMAVSSDQRDYVLEYWMKMLNESNGNFVLLDNEFGVLSSKLAFTIYPNTWVAENNAPFYYKSTVTMDAVVQDNSIVEAYFEDILVSTGVILHSVTQNGTELTLVFYADSAKQSAVKGFVKYVYTAPGQQPLPAPGANVMSKTFSANGTYDAHDENKDGYNPVVVDVPDQLNDYFNRSLTEYEDEQLVYADKTSFFASFPFLSKVNLPNLRTMEADCFRNCFQLEEVNIPKCYIVSADCFQSCIFLSSISLPECLDIREGAFSACSLLTEINIPNCVNIGRYAFQYCHNLSKFFAPNAINISNYSTFTNCPIEEFIIPKCLLLSSGMFSGSALSVLKIVDVRCCSSISDIFRSASALPSISLPECVSFGSYAFYYCNKLSAVQFFQASVPTLLNAQAFYYTPMSQSSYLGYFGSIFVPSQAVESYKSATNWIAYSNRITALPSEYNSRFVYGYEFYDRSDLTEIPSEKQNVEMICNNAFKNCTSLTEAIFSECGYIGQSAFDGCVNLSSISFPKCSYVGQYAFRGCSLLEELNFSDILNCYSNIFSGCSNLKKVIMPNLRSIDTGFLKNQYLLSSISFPKCSYVGYNAFQNCSSLTEANFPECLRVASSAFQSCFSLTEANFPKCSQIDGVAFYSCSALSSISFPECKYIGAQAFQGCSALTEVTLPECLSTDYGVFSGCRYLATVNLPKCSKSPGFSGCYSLRNVYMPNLLIAQEFSQTAIQFVSFPKCIEVGYAAFEGRAISSFSLPKCIRVDGRAFSGCYNLTEANLPECLTIDYCAFYSCRSLSSLNIPKCTFISSSAFQSCSSLTEANFPNCLSIGVYAFYYCFSLTSINFPNCLSIENYAFQSCSSLTKASFPKCVNISGNYVFGNCTHLSQFYLLNSSVAKLSNSNTFYSTPMSDSSYLGYFGSIYVRASLLSDWQNADNWSYYSARMVGLTDEQIAALDNNNNS